MSRPNLIFALVIALSIGALIGFQQKKAPASPRMATAAVKVEKRTDPPPAPVEAPPPVPIEPTPAPTSEPVSAVAPPALTPGNFPPETIPVAALKNAGNASARDALETFVWAAATRETGTLVGLIMWTTPQRREEFIATPAARSGRNFVLGTPEKLVASMYANDSRYLTEVQMTPTTVADADRQQMRVRFTYTNGASREELFLIRRTPTGWQRDLDDTTIYDLANRLGFHDRRGVNAVGEPKR